MIKRFMSAGILALSMATGCGYSPSQSQVANAVDAQTERARFDAAELLDLIADAQDNRPIQLPADVRPQQVEAAFSSLHGRLKINEQRPSELEADPVFAQGLSEHQKQGLAKLKMGFTRRVNANEIRVTRGPDGRMKPDAANGVNEGRGQGQRERHATGDGWWSWRTSYSWWGVTVTLNHNFLYYLCRYTSWMLGAASIPGWIETILSWIACAPHNYDAGSDGARVYITWAGVFWYSA